MDSKYMTPENDGYMHIEAGDKFWELLEMIFTDEFMQKYTNFDSFEPFKYSSAVMVNWGGDEMIYMEDVFNNFVKESTVFQTWDEMVMKATDLKFAK